ncbi:MAG: hypothetical protein ACI81I_001050 [Arcobacteraceae bacterium]|jgi:hypothetical protein
MGKNLHYATLPYLENALINHDKVESFEKIETEEDILYNIKRYEKKDLLIWISDSYEFFINDYLQKPKNIDFIYCSKPEGDYSHGKVVEMAYDDGINIGKIDALLGIIYQNNIKDYIPPERRKE